VNGHLGDQVAAFVDGQLDYPRRERALQHLSDCAQCRAAVDQQRWVKTRVQTLPSAEPSASLLSALTQVSTDPPSPTQPAPDASRRPVPGGPARRGALLLAGAGSLAAGFIGIAYAVGSASPVPSSPVSPPVGQFSAEFADVAPMPFNDPAMDLLPALRDQTGVGRR
jgi:anti-sigma factor RsiW